jgi:DNA-binding NarL/FixJ family response regulator
MNAKSETAIVTVQRSDPHFGIQRSSGVANLTATPEKTERTKILIVDDHAIVRTGLVALLHSQADMIVVGEASTGSEAYDQYFALRPDVTLMDLQMPGPGGLQATINIRADDPNAKIIILTTYSGDVQATRALKAGAIGYLLKTAMRSEIFNAVRAARQGLQYICPEIAEEIADHATCEPLTPREVAILEHLSAGSSNKVIARNLSITDQTVKWHLKSIFNKLGASDRTEAVLKAGKRGVFEA